MPSKHLGAARALLAGGDSTNARPASLRWVPRYLLQYARTRLGLAAGGALTHSTDLKKGRTYALLQTVV